MTEITVDLSGDGHMWLYIDGNAVGSGYHLGPILQRCERLDLLEPARAELLHQQRRWDAVRLAIPANEFRAITQLYGINADYAERLIDYTRARGYVVHHNQNRTCSRLLVDPNHRNASSRHVCDRGDGDHTVLLRRADARGWAILSQPYDSEGEPAPYGRGTIVQLRVGDLVPAATESPKRRPSGGAR